jgi:2',3'-cyclic-nucleotide 2'-phosphodiesterase/3'-nucleotidase
VGYLVTDAIRQVMNVDIAFQNSGGLRADLPAGIVTRGMIYEVMPFENTVVTMRLSGHEVRRALEEGLRGGRVAQVSGIRYVYDLDAPPMSRVVEITNADGSPFDFERDYKVAVNNFMAEGGDQYDLFRTARDKVDTQVPVREELEAYVRDRSAGGGSLDVRPEGRITRKSR